MPKQWRMIRVPTELADRLDAMVRSIEQAHQQGRVTLPAEFADRVPLYYAIDRLLSEVEARRVRSRAPRRRKANASP